MTMTHSTRESLSPVHLLCRTPLPKQTLLILTLPQSRTSQLKSSLLSPNLKRVPAPVKRNRTRNRELTTTMEVTVTTNLTLALEPAVMPPKSLPSSERSTLGLEGPMLPL